MNPAARRSTSPPITLETELIDRSVWATHDQARVDIFDWLETFYNPVRRHSSLGNLAPIEFERRYRLVEALYTTDRT